MAEAEAPEAAEETSQRDLIASLVSGDGEPSEPQEGGETDPPASEAQAEETTPPAASESQQDPSGATQEGLSDTGATQTLEAPADWQLSDQELFRSQPAEVQQAWLDRVAALDQEHEQRSQAVAPLQQAIEPYRGYIQQLGTTPELYVGQLMQTAVGLFTGSNDQKKQILLELANAAQVDFGQPEQAPAEGEDPFGIAAMIDQRLAPFTQQLQQFGGTLTQFQQGQQQAAGQALYNEIEQFVTATNEDGSPAHPYAGELLGEIETLKNMANARGEQPTLKELYDRASWMNEGVRNKMLSAQRHKEQQERQAEIEKRRAASGGVVGGGGAASEAKMDQREFIAAQLRKRRSA